MFVEVHARQNNFPFWESRKSSMSVEVRLTGPLTMCSQSCRLLRGFFRQCRVISREFQFNQPQEKDSFMEHHQRSFGVLAASSAKSFFVILFELEMNIEMVTSCPRWCVCSPFCWPCCLGFGHQIVSLKA